ncbi:MAG TPA: FemAB family XrtA/PEP-CTERM system-associated protein [Candidatus Acidoferrales bacterium]|nr:FemAB family XrtA/PEP-CTERM system-associated protein [Candidatus Acidoferrales bacterium]
MRCLFCQDFDPRWNDFVVSRAEGTFFHLLEWKDLLARRFGYEPYYLYVEQSGEIAGILPLFLVKSFLFGRSLVTLPLAVYGGPVARDGQAEQMLWDRAWELARRLGVRYVEIRGNPHRGGASLPGDASNRLEQKDLYVTFMREIDPDPAANLAQIPRKQRRMIRQGEKFGLRSVMDDRRLADFYRVYAASVRHLGTPVYDYRYFEDLKATFKEKCRILLVERQQKVVAGVLTFLFKDQVLPYYGGSLPESRDCAPNDFMYWELMRFGAAGGYRVFDFGRSKRDTGSYHFKRHWGFTPRELPYLYLRVNGRAIPDTSSLNPRLQWAIKLWRRMPLKLTTIVGPRLVRHFP